MPSTKMRRSTRVFGTRVLRSGRRLSTGKIESRKHMRGRDLVDEDWIDILDNSGGDNIVFRREFKKNGKRSNAQLIEDTDDEMDVDAKRGPELGDAVEMRGLDDDISAKKWGVVYTRKKRKRLDSKSSDSDKSSDKMYGKKFVRRGKKRSRADPMVEHVVLKSEDGMSSVSRSFNTCRSVWVAVEHSSSLFSCLLNFILQYMTRVRVRLPQLAAFLLSNPITDVFCSQGIRFMQVSTGLKTSGSCVILGSRNSTPIFTVDYSAVPKCFMYFNFSLFRRSSSLPHILFLHSMGIELRDNTICDEKEQPPSHTFEIDLPICVTNEVIEPSYILSEQNQLTVPRVRGRPKRGRRKVTKASTSKVVGRTMQLRSSVTNHGIQKRRSTLRLRKRRNTQGFSIQRAKNDSSSKQDGVPFFPIKSDPELMRSIRRISAAKTKELKSNLLGLTRDIDSTICFANLLISNEDKGYREENVVISLELSCSQQWVLLVKKNEITRFTLVAEKSMRPCSSNRITHSIIWTVSDGWKLEFPNRQDWFIFKELYRICSERNLAAPTLSVIPVPRVREVEGYEEMQIEPFRLPESYIHSKGDEVAWALDKRNRIYDMDCEDEEWLSKFNSGSHDCLSDDTFERTIDAYERGSYCHPDDFLEVKKAVDRCLQLASTEVLEAVHGYWTGKRKRKRSALVREFQCNQRRRGELTFNTVLRKKRSFKRQKSQGGRGKQLTLLKAFANEQTDGQARSGLIQEQEAKSAAARMSEEIAVAKRQRAQLLMEAADLATYKAMMALRIAEAAARAGKPLDASVIAPFFPGD